MPDCLFCKIIAGETSSSIVYQDDRIVAFNDITPRAPLHVLLVPRRHIATLNDLADTDDALVGELIRRAAAIAETHGHAARGYRVLFNCNEDAGQSVFHLHLHLLAGRTFSWPPG